MGIKHEKQKHFRAPSWRAWILILEDKAKFKFASVKKLSKLLSL